MLALFILSVALLNSCSKDDTSVSKVSVGDEYGKYTKEIVVSDENSGNSIVLQLGSNDQSILEKWSAKNFGLLPILEGQSISEVISAKYSSTENAADEIEDGMQNENVASSLSIRIMSKNLKSGIKNVALTTFAPESDLRGWNYATYFSQINVDKTFYIERHSLLHRVYFGLKYMSNSTSTWSTIVSEWNKLNNKESYSVTRNPCYQMKARVQYKKTSHFTIYFEP
jgi:hypothetical protein